MFKISFHVKPFKFILGSIENKFYKAQILTGHKAQVVELSV